jgi:hypothetical protein
MIRTAHFRIIAGQLQQLCVYNQSTAAKVAKIDLDAQHRPSFSMQRTLTAREWIHTEKLGEWVAVPSFASEHEYLLNYGIPA